MKQPPTGVKVRRLLHISPLAHDANPWYNTPMENITLTIEELDRLLALDDGDAALIYLSAKRSRTPAWDAARLREARKKLSCAGLAPSVAVDRPTYDASEIARGMLTDPGYHTVVREAERLLGHALSHSEQQTLFSIYQWRAFQPGVMLILLHDCASEAGKRPFSLRQVEREAAVWDSEGICDEAAAESYIDRRNASRETSSKVYKGLGIFGREPSQTEKKYVASWLELGFNEQAIALAYDKTVINTGKLAWGYCDKILRRWHENGWHTPEQIEGLDKKPSAAKKAVPSVNGGMVDRSRALLQKMREEG